MTKKRNPTKRRNLEVTLPLHQAHGKRIEKLEQSVRVLRTQVKILLKAMK